jgi:hypothetical protein
MGRYMDAAEHGPVGGDPLAFACLLRHPGAGELADLRERGNGPQQAQDVVAGVEAQGEPGEERVRS